MASSELAKLYDPTQVENQMYQKWESAGAFTANTSDERESFCMVIPPPNVTAALHLGHALNNTLQDVIARYKRMGQFATLWMPGTDHAGIATQTVVEKRILASEGKKRTDFEREEFVTRIQDWKDEYEATILNQLKKMGCSCDWDRVRFTMDEVCAKAVRETFFKLFKDGLIYRGKRLVNWDPATQTVLADDEVEHEDLPGFFWYMKYPLSEPVEFEGEKISYVTVATTRPETMLGDTAVAMNPSDPRAALLVGKTIKLPIVGREIPIIADDHVVLPNPESDDEKAKFSTGFLKVTPAHDPDDYQIGQRHDLPMINILAPDGSVSKEYGWDDFDEIDNPDVEQFLGLDRFEARSAIIEWFKSQSLLEKIRDYTHSVGHSYRSHVPIEPYLSDQWYIAVKKQIPSMDDAGLIEGTDLPVNSLAGLALRPLLEGKLTFKPERYSRTYQTWLENLRDWPISRQLWWGHQIPIWSKPGEHENRCDESTISQVFETDEGPVTFACVKPGFEELEYKMVQEGWTRDCDVLDTWFSSALWPFSTLGWPEKTPELEKFYPGNVLSTAREIITLWVSRMVMMGQYCAGDIPFSEVFIHAMIQDGDGKKMSKSLGNGVDPLNIIDSHGADAMRYTLVSMTTQTQDVRMPLTKMKLPDGREINSSPKFDIGRNLANKLWNASRFVLGNLVRTPAWSEIRPEEHLADTWILSKLNGTVREITNSIDNYRFNDVAEKLYHFFRDDFCDWYLEIAKFRINAGERAPKAILAHCLDVILRMMHPVMPFITEAIWEKLNRLVPTRGPGDKTAEDMLILANWPLADGESIHPGAESEFESLMALIREIRNVRAQNNIAPSKPIDIIVEAIEGLPAAAMIENNIDTIKKLANIGDVQISYESVEMPAGSASITTDGVKVLVLNAIDRETEIKRLNKQLETLTKGIKSTEGKLGNEKFVANAPEEVVAREKARLAEMKRNLAAVEDSLNNLTE